MAETGTWLMEAGFIAAEARRLGVPQFAAVVDEHGVDILGEGDLVPAERLIYIFEQRLRRAKVRKDDRVVQLVDRLLSAFRGAESDELNVIHAVAGDMDVILYAEASNEKILAVVVYLE